MAGQITVSIQELLSTPNRLFKRKVLDTMQWIVVDEGPHRPILRNDFPRESDDSSQLHSPRLDIGSVF
jgi:hypothetical protein